jgi:hypothetical protein
MRCRATDHVSFSVVIRPGPSPTADFTFSVDTHSGVSAEVEIHIVGETIEVWRNQSCVAVFDRGHLRAWFAEATGPFGMGDVMFTLDRDGQITITMPDVESWRLDNRTAAEFRTRL